MLRASPIAIIAALLTLLIAACSASVPSKGLSGPSAAGATPAPAAVSPTVGVLTLDQGEFAAATGLAVVVVEDPFVVLNNRLSATEGTCFVLSHAAKSVDGRDLDRRIAAAGGPGRFLGKWEWAAPQGATFADAARAFDATWAASRDLAAPNGWIELVVDARPAGMELTAYTTPLGHQVWLRASLVVPTSCDGNN